jgi:predicted AlkP superfamily pyrophosphatase or phosphodiesterase
MLRASPIRRVVLVVLDGLRPDAIPRFGLTHISRLAHTGASTMLGRTVSPSVTACAMASLLTGAAPERHGLQSERFHIPRPRGTLHPLPRLLADHGLPTSAFLAAMPTLFSGIAHRIAAHLGIQQAHFRGKSCGEILATAKRALRDQRRGLIVLHLPDADRAGHDHGWMSDGYAMAARHMDVAVGELLQEIDLTDPSTLVIALADHGGGGAVPDHHNSEHPLDRTIPVILAGGAVQRGELAPGSSLLDVPATICWALGVPRPESYAGTPLTSAILRTSIEAAA